MIPSQRRRHFAGSRTASPERVQPSPGDASTSETPSIGWLSESRCPWPPQKLIDLLCPRVHSEFPCSQRSWHKQKFSQSLGRGEGDLGPHGLGARAGPDPVSQGKARRGGCRRAWERALWNSARAGRSALIDGNWIGGSPIKQAAHQPSGSEPGRTCLEIRFSNRALTRKEIYKWRCQNNCKGKCQTEI